MAQLNEIKRKKLKDILLKILEYKSLDLKEFLAQNGKRHWLYSERLEENRAYYTQLLDLIFSFDASVTMSLIDESGNVIKEFKSDNSKGLSKLFADFVKSEVLKRFGYLVFFLRKIGYVKNDTRHLNDTAKTSLDYNMIFSQELGLKTKIKVHLDET